MDADRQKQLQAFVAYAKTLKGDEKGEAQVFLDRLFQGFSHGGYKEAGATLEARIGNAQGGTSFADLVWKPIVLIEMKKRGEDLARHLPQAFRYWQELVPNRPRYIVLCNFDEMRIYDFDQDIHAPQDTLTLDELPTRYGPLNFLWPNRPPPLFKVDREKVTRGAADLLAKVYRTLVTRKAASEETCQRFVLQALVCLFAEDITLLPKGFFTQLLHECTDPPKAFDLLDGLFRAMNTPDGAKGGRYKDIAFFNGGIFAESAAIELDPANELVHLKKATEYDWSHVSPDIFGTIFQDSMNQDDRHAFGAHYTSQADIMKIVGPTIVQPFTQAIERAGTLKELTAIRDRLATLRVLDPACGSGNFLYIAYREMRRLDAAIVLRQSEMSKRAPTGQAAFASVSPKQFHGLDVLPFAVELAKVTLSLAPKLASDELHTTERTLPLDNLDSNIQCRDALVTPDGTRATWPAADVIIGNPPFLGAKRLKPERGADYVNRIRDLYKDVPGMADFCVYWFRLAHDHLPVATAADPFAGRAGLVGTQNIRNNQSRVGGLDHIVSHGGVIVEAVENQPWSGEAAVHVSIANWVKTVQVIKAPAPAGASAYTPMPGPGPSAATRAASRRKRPDGALPPPAGGGFSKAGGSPVAAEDDAAGMDTPRDQEAVSAGVLPKARRLWRTVEITPELLETDETAKRPKSRVTGKRGGVRKDKSYELEAHVVAHITSSLSDDVASASAPRLKCNVDPQRVFQGVTPGHSAFVLSPGEAATIIRGDRESAKVVRPYLIGRELLHGDGRPQRFIIDFQPRDLIEASACEAAFEHVKKFVLPDRQKRANERSGDDGKARSHHLQFINQWWRLAWERADLFTAIKGKKRFLACSRVTKRPVFVFVSSKIRPGDALQTFAFDDDYSFGLLQSDAHWQWFIANCSKLLARFRYTPPSVFDTFPWPQSPSKKQVRAVAAAGREVRRVRAAALETITGGLRALYRTLELPGKNPLKDAHAALDAAVLDAYGFSSKKDLLAQLLTLNTSVASAIERGTPVTAPGVPPTFGDAAELITADCIEP
jgi:hypothetical protein